MSDEPQTRPEQGARQGAKGAEGLVDRLDRCIAQVRAINQAKEREQERTEQHLEALLQRQRGIGK